MAPAPRLIVPVTGRCAVSRRRRDVRASTVATLIAVAALLLAGCSPPSWGGHSGAVDADAAQQVLDQRAAAVRSADLDAFLRTIDTEDADFVARQRQWFVNVRELPWATFSYHVSGAEWPSLLSDRDWPDDTFVPRVEEISQLDGFDPTPVRSLTGFAFGYRDGRAVVISDRTGAGRPFPGTRPAPWELTRTFPIRSGTALILFDEETRASSARVIRAVDNGIRAVQAAVPYDWNGQVVVYVFASQDVLDSYPEVPGGRISHLGAMTLPAYASVDGGDPTSIRFAILPSSLRAGQAFLDRITRHELTHVALETRDVGAPTWVAEGIAEYVAARALPPTGRRIATAAVRRARHGAVAMPSSADFNGADQSWNYAIAWMACDYIAETYGEPVLWQMVLASGGGTMTGSDAEQDAVLVRILGLTGAELAARAAERIVSLYG